MDKKKKIIVAILGSFIEWYDFAMIGALSIYISKNFFDVADPMGSLINIFFVFAVGYLARPLGAIFFGYYGDQFGRKIALRWSLVLVSSTTLLIGCLPTLSELGILAMAFLVVLRFIQGFGAGGEHAGGILLLYEAETTNQYARANYAILAIMVGLFFGFFSAYLLRLFFFETEIINWAWRIPFIFGGLFGFVGVVLRMRYINEIPSVKTSTGLRHYQNFFSENKKSILTAAGIYIHSVAIFHVNYFFYPGYMEKQGLIASDVINEIRVLMAIAFIILFLIFGKNLNNRNAANWLKLSSLWTVILIFPLHYAMSNFGVVGYCVATGILTVLNVIYLLPVAGTLADMFPVKYRYTGVTLSINIVSSLFGGTAPLLLALLVSYSGSFFASGTYLFFTATIGYLTISWKPQESREKEIYVS
jgi:MHS family proline/betaine transporter-like MFS transporter